MLIKQPLAVERKEEKRKEATRYVQQFSQSVPISEVLLYYKPLTEQRNVLHFLPAEKIMELFLVVSEGKSRCDIFQAENLLYSIQKCAFYCS